MTGIIQLFILSRKAGGDGPSEKQRGIGASILNAYKQGINFVFFSLSFTIISTSDVIIVGIMQPYEQVGVYSIAASMAVTGSLGLLTINSFTPRLISRLHAKNKIKRLNIILNWLGKLNLVVLLVVLVSLLGVLHVLYSDSPNFMNYISCFLIYYLGVSVNVISGPCAFALNMTGHSGVSTRIIIFASLMIILLDIPLVYFLGIPGAAIGTAAVLCYMNILMSYKSKKLIGIKPGLI